ncbi:MAG: hypothetical protein ABIO39_00280 [Caulobacteraceae bacterium]
MQFLMWLEDSPLSQFILEDAYAHPILLCIHAVGMAIVVGLVLMFCLRVMGYPKALPLSGFKGLIGLGWAGFALNAASGAVMFASRATSLIVNLDFQLKLALIVLGGVSMFVLSKTARAALEGDDRAQFTPPMKALALFTALLWIGAIIFGRYIGYTLQSRLTLGG